MPDLDHLPRHIRQAWRRVADDITAQRPPTEVADQIERVCAKTLRGEDLRWTVALADAVDRAWRTGTSAPVEEAVTQLGPAARSGLGACFIDAARVLGAQGVSPLGELPDALSCLVASAFRRIPDKMCFGFLEPSLADGTFATRQAYRDFIREVESLIRFDSMVGVVLRDQSSGRVRAPNRRRRTRDTEDLMDVPVASL